MTLEAVRYLAWDEASSPTFRHMLDAWRLQVRGKKAGSGLAGEYLAWRVEGVKVLREPQALARDDVVGNLTHVNELKDAGWTKLLGCAFTDGTLVDGEALGARCAMLQVPVNIADMICSPVSLVEVAAPVFVANSCGVQPSGGVHPAEIIADEPADAANEPAQSALERWRGRGAGWRNEPGYNARTVVFEVEATRLGLMLQSMRELPVVCRHAARMLCPEKDMSGIKYPNKEQLRLFLIRLDMINMLWQRRFRLNVCHYFCLLTTFHLPPSSTFYCSGFSADRRPRGYRGVFRPTRLLRAATISSRAPRNLWSSARPT